MKRTLIAVLPCALWLSACTPATTDEAVVTDSGSSGSQSSTEATTDASKAQVAAEDMQFMKDAAQGGMAEVKMGELATSNGESQPVKALAKKLVTDHGKVNEELKQLATRKSVMLPDAVSEQQKTMLQHLSSLKGSEFDAAFKQHAVENHQKSIEKFKAAAEKAKDADLKAFAAKTLPVLQQHLDLAKQLSATPAATQPQ
jgi:putative membrane protein